MKMQFDKDKRVCNHFVYRDEFSQRMTNLALVSTLSQQNRYTTRNTEDDDNGDSYIAQIYRTATERR